jgi:hypothetical protein
MEQPPTVEPAAFPPAPGGADDPLKPEKSRTRLAIVGVLVVATLIVGGIVAAIATGGRDDQAEASPPVSDSPSPEAVAPTPPASLKARAKPFVVVLTWTGPLPDDPLDRYEVHRNGTFIGYATPAERKYRDTSALPGKRYRYEVRVETEDGVFSDPVRVRIKTPIPPLVQARVEGTFDARTSFNSKVGYGDYTAPTFGWELTPVCASGPCAVRLRDSFYDDLRIKLNRSGGSYAGSFSGQIGLQCQGTPSTSTGSITLRVAKARVVDGEWRATLLEGTMTHQEAAQLGCRSGSANLSVRARFIQ